MLDGMLDGSLGVSLSERLGERLGESLSESLSDWVALNWVWQSIRRQLSIHALPPYPCALPFVGAR